MADAHRDEARLSAAPPRKEGAMRWLVYSPVLLAAGLMIPRLASAQFGLLDDGYTLMTVRRILWGEWSMLQVPWEVAAGRLRPTYWLLNIGLDLLAGKSPFWFYFANTCLLCAAVGGLIWLVRLTGGSRLRAVMTGILFAMAGPAVESYYTLSKGEAIQVVCLIASLIGIVLWNRARTRRARLGWWLGVLIALLFAFGSKETGVAILPVSAGGLAAGLVRSWVSKNRDGLGARAAYFGAALAASICFLGLVSALRGTGFMQGGYSGGYALDRATLIAVVVRWTGWLIRDFGYLIPLGLVVVAAWLVGRTGSLGGPLLDGLIWMGVWVLVFLPWARYMVEYYMLPFAIGASGFGAAAAELAWRLATDRGRLWRGVAWAGLVLSAVLWILSLPTNWSNARVQLAVDAANTDVLRYLSANALSHGQVLVNIQDPNEYVVEFGLNLSEFYGRSDIIGLPVQLSDPRLGAYGDGPTLVAVPEAQDTPKLSVRMGVIDDTQQAWNSSLRGRIQGRSVLVFQSERVVRLAAFDSPRLLCRFLPATGYCSAASPLLDTDQFVYGWRVYRLD